MDDGLFVLADLMIEQEHRVGPRIGGRVQRRDGRTRVPLLSLAGGYALAGCAVATRRGSSPLLTSLALALVHLSYGAGVISGALRPDLVSSSLASTRLR